MTEKVFTEFFTFHFIILKWTDSVKNYTIEGALRKSAVMIIRKLITDTILGIASKKNPQAPTVTYSYF